MNCVFCKLVEGDAPCDKLYEDDLVLAFLDIAPINPGHSLVIPREHHTSATTIPEAVAGRLMTVATRLGQAIVRAVDGDGFNLHLANGRCAGQAVPHAHLHVIPRHGTDGFSWNWRRIEEDANARRELLADVRKRLGVADE